MTVRAWTVVGASLVLASTVAHPAGAPKGPRFIHAERHDRSRALRDMPPLPAGNGTLFEVPRRWRSRGQRSIDTVVQTFAAAPLVPAPSMSFEGVGNVNAVLPPDTNGDVGPIHFVQWVNLSFAIYAKGSSTAPPTRLYGPASGNTLWSGFGGPCETTNNGDPVVRYDHLADRWVMSQLAIPNSFFGIPLSPTYQCIAVSATSDPTGAYYRYQFQFDKLNDYPKFGVWPDAYYMTINQFSTPTLTFAGQGVAAFDRASMLQGAPAGMVFFDLSSVDMNLGGMLPSDLDGPPPPAGAPNTFAQIDDDAWGYSPDQLQLWDFHVDWTNVAASSFTRRAAVPTAPFDSDMCGGSETCIPQPGTTAKVDALSDRLMYRLVYRNLADHESLVVNHTVDVDGTDHAGVRWYEIRDPHGAPVIYQQGTYAPDSDHRWMGSAAMDGAGNIAIGFSVAGTSTFPSVRYAARLTTDPLGELSQGEATMIAGAGSQTHSSGRWGDYSMLTVDPSDDCTFWYTQQYYASTSSFGWQTRIGTFALPSCVPTAPALPTISVVATTPTASEAGRVAGAFTVTRSGDLSSAATITYHVSGTATPGSDYDALSGTLTFAVGASSAVIGVTPIDDTLVEPNESVIVTLDPSSAYSVGAPGSALVTIVSDDVPSDLVVSTIAAPSIGGANAAITLSDTTTNQGAGPADPSATAFYLSANPLLDGNDVQIGTRAIPTLAAGASSSGTTSATIPAGTTPGIYYVIAKADAVNAIVESQENNNTKLSTPIMIGPDLVVSAVTSPVTAAAGGPIVVTDTTMNRGGGNAGPSTTSFYLSTNVALDGSDILLGSRTVDALAANASSSATTTLTVPPGTPAGAYFVIVQADATNAVAESVETNNTRFGTQTLVGPDLAVGKITVPAIGGAGSAIVISDTTQNKGAAASPASTTGFYLSTNFVLDSSDVFIGGRSVPPLDAGAGDTATTTLTLPASLATGSYQIIARADDSNAVAEASETNNVLFSATIRVGPDLTVTSTTAPAIGGSGGSIVVTDTTKNVGGGAVGASTTGLYLSTSPIFSASATLLGTRPVPPLAPAASDTASTAVILPSNLAPGTYYVLASADVPGQVVETNETNNASFGAAVRIGPDLMESALTAPTSAARGSSVTANDTVSNQGGGSAPPSTTRFYLSTNLTLDSGDLLIGSRTVAAIGPGQSSSGSSLLTIPAGLAPGSYWIIAAADADGAVAESNETNNTRAALIQVK